MSFALDPSANRLFVLATCLFAREGLRVVPLPSGGSRLLNRRVCGSDLTLGPGGTLLATSAPLIWPSPRLLVLDRSSGRLLRRRTLPASVLALLDAG
jgi:hypothetical protein